MLLYKKIILYILGNPVFRRLSKIPSIKSIAFRYVGDENIDSFISKLEEVLNEGYKVTLSYLGEHYSNEKDVDKYKQEIINIIEKLSNFNDNKNDSISIKLTALGLLISEEKCIENLEHILSLAQKYNLRVHIDMESSDFVDKTLEIFSFLRNEKNYNNLDLTFQAYLYRTSKDIDDRILSYNWIHKPIIRICKGAYSEPFDKVFPNKKLIDDNYYNLAIKLLDNIEKVYPAFATHDYKLIEKIKNYVQYKGISKENFEFQMLYGVNNNLQKKIISQNYNLRIYIPIGKDWYDYFIRRVAERPSNIFYLISSFFKAKKYD